MTSSLAKVAGRLVVFRLAKGVTSLGPGKRVVLWLSGCKMKCPGCIAPELWPRKSGEPVEISVLVARMKMLSRQNWGITISGGEPLDQAKPLGIFLLSLRKEIPAWDVLLYSGYTLEQIAKNKQKNSLVQELVDLLVDGPFRQEEPPVHPLAGSGNQRIIPLTHRGKAMVKEISEKGMPVFNLGRGSSGTSLLIGVGDPSKRREVHQDLGLKKAGR